LWRLLQSTLFDFVEKRDSDTDGDPDPDFRKGLMDSTGAMAQAYSAILGQYPIARPGQTYIAQGENLTKCG
jgi:hypothetical protein